MLRYPKFTGLELIAADTLNGTLPEELLKNHEAAIGESVQTSETKFKNIVDGFKGVWVDKKTFNRYYWGFIGLLEIAVCALSLVLYYWLKFGAPWKC